MGEIVQESGRERYPMRDLEDTVDDGRWTVGKFVDAGEEFRASRCEVIDDSRRRVGVDIPDDVGDPTRPPGQALVLRQRRPPRRAVRARDLYRKSRVERIRRLIGLRMPADDVRVCEMHDFGVEMLPPAVETRRRALMGRGVQRGMMPRPANRCCRGPTVTIQEGGTHPEESKDR